MTIFFTGDLHLGHENCIRFCDRPFSGLSEMNESLIANINETVGADDELWILGDFSFRMPLSQAIESREKIVCPNVHLVYGNHDLDYDGLEVFSSTQHYKELCTEYGKLVLFHYPIASWNARIHGRPHLHGHIHSRSAYNEDNAAIASGPQTVVDERGIPQYKTHRIWDVGVDANDYRPVSLDHIAERLRLDLHSEGR